MKNIFLSLLAIGLFTGCYFENKIQRNSAKEARDSKLECFIEFNDGKIIPFETLEIKSPPLQYEFLLGDGKKLNYDVKEIHAFQTKKYYAIKIYNQSGNVIGKLPFTELFASRIVDGKIELFAIGEMKRDTYGPNQPGYSKSYFLRKGKGNNLISATKKNLKNYITDNKSLSEEFESLYKSTYPFKSIMKILEQYN